MQYPTYPKIDTLYERDANSSFKVMPGVWRRREFCHIKQWQIFEKVDGTNVRISWDPIGLRVLFWGRTDKADLPKPLEDYLIGTFTPERLGEVLDGPAVLYGEGYGPKIQKGGRYRDDVAVRLFDALALDQNSGQGVWLPQDTDDSEQCNSVTEIAARLGVRAVPYLGMMETDDAVEMVMRGFTSAVAVEDGGPGCFAEGIVARTDPLLLDRCGGRVVWKLKTKDF